MASSLERFHCRYVMCIFTLNCSYGLLYTECKELKMILHGHNTRAKMLWIEYHKYIMWFMKQLDFFFDRSVKPIIWVLISHLIVTGSIQIHCTCTCYWVVLSMQLLSDSNLEMRRTNCSDCWRHSDCKTSYYVCLGVCNWVRYKSQNRNRKRNETKWYEPILWARHLTHQANILHCSPCSNSPDNTVDRAARTIVDGGWEGHIARSMKLFSVNHLTIC